MTHFTSIMFVIREFSQNLAKANRPVDETGKAQQMYTFFFFLCFSHPLNTRKTCRIQLVIGNGKEKKT